MTSNGLDFTRLYTSKCKEDVWNTVDWETRTARIETHDGKVIFEQENIEVPSSWSQLALNIVAQKYFRGSIGTPERETSVKQLIKRVANTFKNWGIDGNYFVKSKQADVFYDELCYILLHQIAAFNSPVWFNLGWPGRRQAISACYINEVDDTIESILDLYKTEGMLFKDGSGSGINLSILRSSKEALAAGGKSSGPVSFMKGLDASAGAIKSGGSTRRAACMRILDVDHPDIMEFIRCKADSEKKAHALIDVGYNGAFNIHNGAYDTVPFQNANHSVRVTDDFMKAVLNDDVWTTYTRNGHVSDSTYKAKDILHEISEAAWVCGDPGLQYDTTINDWHTCSETDRIYASNPCSEYMFLNSTACNLASLNLIKFVDPKTLTIDIDAYCHTARIMIVAQEIGVGFAEYPTEKIAQMSFAYRTLGLGYANLGTLLLSKGIPYDSEEGRTFAALLTSIMTATAYEVSSQISMRCTGPFEGYAKNRKSMLSVIEKHRHAADELKVPHGEMENLDVVSKNLWSRAEDLGKEYGFRNAQVTVLAPTGTIGFMMDCDTTGIEPAIALVSYKMLVGGGNLKLVNGSVKTALLNLGYPETLSNIIIEYVNNNDTIEGCPHLLKEHLPVFDCAFQPAKGFRSIHYMGHIRMMSVVQPFLSGAISKTVNVPENVTVEEISKTYIDGWKLGLKAIAIYRDGSKRTQPLSTKRNTSTTPVPEIMTTPPPVRERLPSEREAITHKFTIAGQHEGYITVGMYPDGRPGEVFITMAKEGSTVSGLVDAFATVVSMALQYRVPLPKIANKFINTRFEPNGFTDHPQIRIAKSITDYIFRWLMLKFPDEETFIPPAENELPVDDKLDYNAISLVKGQTDAPPCPECGSLTVRNGACYLCRGCGTSLGCS